MIRHFEDRAVSSDRISPTALYTASTWVRHGLLPAPLVPRRGWWMHTALHPIAQGMHALGAPSLDDMLLVRHELRFLFEPFPPCTPDSTRQSFRFIRGRIR